VSCDLEHTGKLGLGVGSRGSVAFAAHFFEPVLIKLNDLDTVRADQRNHISIWHHLLYLLATAESRNRLLNDLSLVQLQHHHISRLTIQQHLFRFDHDHLVNSKHISGARVDHLNQRLQRLPLHNLSFFDNTYVVLTVYCNHCIVYHTC
jgi:hypothetical protein